MPVIYITTKYERCSMTGGESISKGPMERQPTGKDRVRMVARQISEPRTANWIASEPDWSYGPTKRALKRLVDDGILHRDDTGAHTTYFPDYRRQALTEAIRFGIATTPSKISPNDSPR